jgi:3-hydroxyisobutyrate dehydrogenase-like beta-hydroxyacid dehydrogenase
MGSAVAARLTEKGATVITSLAGRGEASAKRAAAAGMRAVDDAEIPSADIILSIVPPSEALALAERLAPALQRAVRKPIYIDCNAVSPATVERVGAVVSATGTSFADGGIIGGPPKPGTAGPTFYFSGIEASRVDAVGAHGIKVRVIDGPVGAASALKMSYAAITKGLTALGSASILAATQSGASAALYQELSESQPALLAFLARQVPDMFPKAYRFVGEMEEISGCMTLEGARVLYADMARAYQEIADDMNTGQREVSKLAAFFPDK